MNIVTDRSKRRACAAHLRASAEHVADSDARERRLALAEAMDAATRRWRLEGAHLDDERHD